MNQYDVIAAIYYLYPALLLNTDFTVTEVDGVGSIATWSNTTVAQPTTDQLTSALNTVQLAGYKVLQTAAIERAYNVATYQTPVAYMGTTFWTDRDSQFVLMGAFVGFTQAGATPDGFTWWDATDTPVPMTLAQLQGLFYATLTMCNTNFGKRKTAHSQIASATTVASVQAITW